MEDSPVIDHGTSAVSAATDYYGQPRKQGKQPDMGAVEYGNSVAMPMPVSVPEPTPTPTSTPTVTMTSSPNETMAGGDDLEEWRNVPELATSSSNVQSMKARIVEEILYVRLTGYLLGEKGQFYLNTDLSGKTGFQAPFWDQAGADFMIEDGILYAYSGLHNKEWKWSERKSYKRLGTFSATSTSVEVSIPLEDLGMSPGSPLQLGYVWKDSPEHKLPVAKRLSQVSVNLSPLEPAAATSAIKVDGRITDWKEHKYSAEGSNPKGLKLSHDDQYLYVMTEGSRLASKTQFYLNTDDNSETGYKTSAWSASGAEILIEYGRMYKYTGNGENWSWELIVNLKSDAHYVANETVLETALRLDHLGIQQGDSLRIGVLLNDDKSTKLPKTGGMIVYSTQ